MSKRRDRDFYPTPLAAVPSLIPHLKKGQAFIEPCAGDGALCRHLENFGFCSNHSSDIEPRAGGIVKMDAFDIKRSFGYVFITNPPWPARSGNGDPTVGLIKHLSAIAPTWMLLSSDFAHNKYFSDLVCRKIVSVGRLKWVPDSKSVGFDNCAWYLFDKKLPLFQRGTLFYGR